MATTISLQSGRQKLSRLARDEAARLKEWVSELCRTIPVEAEDRKTQVHVSFSAGAREQFAEDLGRALSGAERRYRSQVRSIARQQEASRPSDAATNRSLPELPRVPVRVLTPRHVELDEEVPSPWGNFGTWLRSAFFSLMMPSFLIGMVVYAVVRKLHPEAGVTDIMNFIFYRMGFLLLSVPLLIPVVFLLARRDRDRKCAKNRIYVGEKLRAQIAAEAALDVDTCWRNVEVRYDQYLDSLAVLAEGPPPWAPFQGAVIPSLLPPTSKVLESVSPSTSPLRSDPPPPAAPHGPGASAVSAGPDSSDKNQHAAPAEAALAAKAKEGAPAIPMAASALASVSALVPISAPAQERVSPWPASRPASAKLEELLAAMRDRRISSQPRDSASPGEGTQQPAAGPAPDRRTGQCR